MIVLFTDLPWTLGSVGRNELSYMNLKILASDACRDSNTETTLRIRLVAGLVVNQKSIFTTEK